MASLDAERGASESRKEQDEDKQGPPASSCTSGLKRERGEADDDNAPLEQKQRSESGIACNINANDPDKMGAERGYNDVYKDNQEARQTAHSGSAAALRQGDKAMGAANLATSRMPAGPGVQANFQPGTMQQHLFMNTGRMPTAGGQQIPASWQQAHPQTTSQHQLQNYVLEPANQHNALGMQQGQHQKGGQQQDEDTVGNSNEEKKSQQHPPSHQPAAGGAVPLAGEDAHAAPHAVLPATMKHETGEQKTADVPIGAAEARANSTATARPAADHDHSQEHISAPQGASAQLPEAQSMALQQQKTNPAQMHPNIAQFAPHMFQHDNNGNIPAQSGVPGGNRMFMPQFPPMAPTMIRPFFAAGQMGRQRFGPPSGFIGQQSLAPRTNGISLALSCDDEQLSEYQIYVRKQLEIFEALQEDVESNTQGRKKQVVLGQVGIRCRHCAGFPLRQRGRGAVYYPTKLQGIYQAAQNMASSHLCEACQYMPPFLKNELRILRERRDTASGGKQYWADAARAMGLEETGQGCLRLRRRGVVGEPASASS